jgi:hypothetical protein
MEIKEYRVNVTVNADGDGTGYSETAVFGMLYKVRWISGDLADNNTSVLSATYTPLADETLLTLGAGEGDTDLVYYPRALVCDAAGTALTGTAGGDRVCPLVWGKLKLVIAAGGVSKTGGCIAYILEG